MSLKAFAKRFFPQSRVPSPFTKGDLSLAVGAVPKNNPLPPISDAQLTTLSNGIRVVSVENHSPITGVAALVTVGSRWEDRSYNGISALIERLSLRSTRNQHAAALHHTLLTKGANATVTTSRDGMVFYADGARGLASSLTHALRDITTNQAFDPLEVDQAKAELTDDIAHRTSNPEVDIVDSLHLASFGASSYGLPVVGSKGTIEGISGRMLTQFRDEHFTPDRIVLAGCGIDHDSFVKEAEAAWGNLKPRKDGARLSAPRTQWFGSDVRQYVADSGFTTVALGFPTEPVSHPDFYATVVLQGLLGGGSSFSAGGPGKGMHSLLFTRVLNQFSWAASAMSSCFCYDEAGVFAVAGTAAAQHGEDIIAVLASELANLTGPIAPDQLQRAKNYSKGLLLMDLERRNVLLEDMARNVVTFGYAASAAQHAEKLDAVTEADLRRVVTRLVSSPPAFAAIGDTVALPSHSDIVHHMKELKANPTAAQ